MRDPIDIAFRVTLIATALVVLAVILAGAVTSTVHPVTAAAIGVLCAFVSVNAWRGR